MFEQNLEAVKYNESIQSQLNQICEPLKKYLRIEHVLYGRFYENNQAFYLCNHQDILHFTLVQSGVNGWKFQEEVRQTSINKHFLWGKYPQEDHLLAYYYDALNIWNGCTIYKRRRDFMEHWTFMPFRTQEIQNDFYIKNLDLFEHFCQYYVDKASEFINKADKPLAYFECDITFIGEKSEQRERFINATPIKKYHLSIDDLEITLTPQEFECLKYYAQGKSMKEIAQIKTLAPRTVEAHLEKVRRKTGCHRKSDLAKLYHTNFPSLIMP